LIFLCCYVKVSDVDPVSFHVSKAVIASFAGASKGTVVLDIALTSGHGGAVSCDAICGLLIECLQDVSSAVPVSFAYSLCC
jgi:hypothetical protein